MKEKINFSDRYDRCLNSNERKSKVYEEAKAIQKEYHLSDPVKNCIARHYFINYLAKLGNVSKTVKFIDSILIYYGLNEEERNKFLNSNYRMYLTDYNEFRIRLAIFNKCGLFEEVLFKKNRFLSNYSTNDAISVQVLYAIIARKNFDITFDELERLSKACINFKELVNSNKLTPNIIKEMDAELLSKIKSYRITRTIK